VPNGGTPVKFRKISSQYSKANKFIADMDKYGSFALRLSGLFKFTASFNLQRFLRSSTFPRYYPFGLNKSRNNSSLINLQYRGKSASGQNPYVISTSWLFRRINPPTPGLEPSRRVEERKNLYRLKDSINLNSPVPLPSPSPPTPSLI
jgi:hypothetical protein